MFKHAKGTQIMHDASMMHKQYWQRQPPGRGLDCGTNILARIEPEGLKNKRWHYWLPLETTRFFVNSFPVYIPCKFNEIYFRHSYIKTRINKFFMRRDSRQMVGFLELVFLTYNKAVKCKISTYPLKSRMSAQVPLSMNKIQHTCEKNLCVNSV